MNRTFLYFAGAAGASLPLLVDATLKAGVLAGIAILFVPLMRKASAAARHLVWLVTILTLLLVPVFSALLPGWRVLPEWVTVQKEVERTAVVVERIPDEFVPSPVAAVPAPVVAAAETDGVPVKQAEILSVSGGGTATVEVPVSAPPASRSPMEWLPVLWAAGCALLGLRILAAQWLLRRTSKSAERVATGPLADAMAAAARQLNLRRRVRLVLGEKNMIPFVWGVFRPHLMLPAEAKMWEAERLHSVMLHELAHIRRRDPLVQWLTQIACALHWFNPLVWFAAWRLHVERERACDDLVLAGGVRPSDYAEHLLEVAAKLSAERWTTVCGLAMARKSSLEGRLLAVLSERLNRRAVTRAITAAALLLGAGIAIPVAMLRAAEEKQAEAQKSEAAAGALKHSGNVKLQPGTEEKLEWGEAVNGLRMALVWPPALGEPVPGETPDLYLAVQNVSGGVVRLCTTGDAPAKRGLNFYTDDRLQFRIGSEEANGGDTGIPPREVVFLRLFMEGADERGVPHGAGIASTLSQSPTTGVKVEMEIAKAPAGAWSGKLITARTRAGVGAEAPKNRKAQELFKVWLAHARVNGKIPGGHIARLGARVAEFVRGNLADRAGEPFAKRMEPIASRLDGTRDWQPVEAAALLNEIAEVSDAPLSVMLEETAGWTIQAEYWELKGMDDAPWGKALPNGLRAAVVLEPGAAEYPLGTSLKVRLLVHNTGEETVVFRTRTWHHIEPAARDAKGGAIPMESITRLTRAPLLTHRLRPGRFLELASPGLGVGRYGYHDFKNRDIASWIGVTKEGDEVVLSPGPLPLMDWNEVPVTAGESRWWFDLIAARLSLAEPLPAAAAERTHLLQRTVRDIYQDEATKEEIAAFTGDQRPDALEALAQRLSRRGGLKPFTGTLQGGTMKFRVTAEAGGDPGSGGQPAASPASEK